ncbi:MAG: hypothetical protein J5962_06205 [Lachnospiraceae bacterium]|nr:hypothetical protein [Lachnospiraceae bacterium]
MGFVSVNEIDKFRYDDCVMESFEITDKAICLELEALIVGKNNSQNENYTESYAGTTMASFVSGKVLGAIKDGYRYYDANEVLQREVPDTRLSDKETEELIKKCPGAFLYSIDKTDEKDGLLYAVLGIEFIDETEKTMADSYQIHIVYEKAIFEWEHYMNRVQA